jgi:hypothetical protein
VGCSQHPLGLCPSSPQKKNSETTSRLLQEESGNLGKRINKDATNNKIATNNSKRNPLKRNFETKRESCGVYVRCINPMSSTHECGSSKIKSGNHGDVEMSIRCEKYSDPGVTTQMQSSIWELFRVGVLAGKEWTTKSSPEKCRLVHAHSLPQGFDCKGSVLYVRLCEREDSGKIEYSDTPILVDTFKNRSDRHNIVTSICGGNPIDIDKDPKELSYYIESIAEFGFNHIIIIGEVEYGILFLDCYERIFTWSDMCQMMFPLGTLEEAPKTLIEKNRLTWFEQNGIVYEYTE